MLFADDSYMYCRANSREAEKVLELLGTFERSSGQQVNRSKSAVFFSTNTPPVIRTQICNFMGMREAAEGSKYLGLPSSLGRNKSALLGYLKDRVRDRIQRWDGKLLSRAGKEMLVKTVCQALPNYAMSVFLLPSDLCKEMERDMSRFWWRQKSNSRGIHWKAWDKLVKHMAIGGMGFRCLRDFNVAMLGKQAWRLLTRPTSMVALVFGARYFPGTNFLNAQLGSNPSYIWRSILESRELLRQGIRRRVGRGDTTSILNDPWLPDSQPFISSQHPSLVGRNVIDLMQTGEQKWDNEVLEDIFNDRDRELILSIPLSQSAPEDRWYWAMEKNGGYTVRSAYKQARNGVVTDFPHLVEEFWKRLWRIKVPLKVKDFLWRAATDCLPTKTCLNDKRVNIDRTCLFCADQPESRVHVLLLCNFAVDCWEEAGIQVQWDGNGGFECWLQKMVLSLSRDEVRMAAMICWQVWRARNELQWNQISATPHGVVTAAHDELKQWTDAQNSEQGGRWTKPSEGTIKINVDGAWFNDERKVGFGFAARNHDGKWMGAGSGWRTGCVGSDFAEAIGIREALTWIKWRGWRNVIVESDSLNVVSALQNGSTFESYLGIILSDCISLMSSFCNFSIVFVKRSANRVAHELARASCSYADRICSEVEAPTELLFLLADDLSESI